MNAKAKKKNVRFESDCNHTCPQRPMVVPSSALVGQQHSTFGPPSCAGLNTRQNFHIALDCLQPCVSVRFLCAKLADFLKPKQGLYGEVWPDLDLKPGFLESSFSTLSSCGFVFVA
jgi:hypothetical protein